MCRPRFWMLRFLQSFLVATHLPRICLAQNGVGVVTASPIPSDQPSSTMSTPAQTHTVEVGLADHKFKPETTVASVGDTVEFAFYPLNHSVVRAEYGFPCIPYEMTGPSKMGFFSGFHPVDKVLSSPSTYRIVINDTDPIFFYCSAPGSCLTYGMVGAINPNSSTSVQDQHQLALNSTYMLNPGEPFPAETPSPNNPPSSTTTSNSGTGKTNNNRSGLSKRAIIAMVITSACITILAALLFFFWGRTKGLKEEVKRKASTVRRPNESPTGNMSMSVPRAELGNTETDNAVHHQPYYYQYHHQPSQPTDDRTAYQPYQHQQYAPHPAYSPAPTMSLYFPPPPPSSPSPPITQPTHSHSPHPHPHIQPILPSPPALPNKCDVISPIGPHPAYSPLEYYQHQYHRQQQQYHTAMQPPTRHELSSMDDSQVHKLDPSNTGTSGNAENTVTAATTNTTTRVEQETELAQYRARDLTQNTTSTTSTSSNGNADEIEVVPSYFDSVYASRPAHVSSRQGPEEKGCAEVNEKNEDDK